MNRNFNSAFYKKILDQINSNIYITDVETDEIVYMNKYMKDTFQVGDIKGKKCWQVLQSGMDKRCDFCKIKQLQESNLHKVCVWYEKNTITGKTYLNHDTLELWQGRLYHLQNSIDVTEHIQLSIEATIDELTGILNRNAGKKRIEQLLTSNHFNEEFVVVLYDMNGLKWVNDTYGHLEGDRLLIFVAQNISKRLEDPDFIFRLSGDEFIIVFFNKTANEVEHWMENILLAIDEERIKENIDYETSFSYGIANIHIDNKLTVSDVLSLADSQMYIQKRDYHILMNKKRLVNLNQNESVPMFEYNRDHLFEGLSEAIDDYLFVGNLKTGKFMYSRQMMIDFHLPNQVLDNAAAFWGEKIHPDDRDVFLKSNQEIADGRIEQHTIYYRVKDADDRWVPLLCKGRMIRDKNGEPDLFAGTIRNFDKNKDSEIANPEYLSPYLDNSYYIYDNDNKNNFIYQKSFYFVNLFNGQDDLKTKNNLLDFVNKNIPGGIMAVLAQPGFPLYCFNQAVLDYTRYSYDELCQVTNGYFNNIIYEKDRQLVETEVFKQLEQNGKYEIRYRIVCQDGQLLWVYEQGKYVNDDYGHKLIFSFFVDITNEMDIEQELRFINENSIDGVFKIAIVENLPVIYANDGYYHIHGYTKKQFHEELNDYALSLVYEDDLQRITDQINELIEQNQFQSILEFRIKKRDKSIAWLYASVSFTTQIDQTVVMIGMVIDITERKNLEEQVYRFQQLFKVVQTKTGLNVWEFNIQNKEVIGNPNFAKIRSYHNITTNIPASIIAQGLVHPQSIDDLYGLYNRLEKDIAPLDATIKIKRKDDQSKYIWEKITYTIVSYQGDKPAWAVGFSEDITEQKEIEMRIYNEESLHKVLNDDIILNIRFNYTNDTVEDSSWYFDDDPEEQINIYSYQDIYNYLIKIAANEDDQKILKQRYSKNQIDNAIVLRQDMPVFEFRQKNINGNISWVSLNMKITISPQNNDIILFIYIKNIDIQKRRELALQNKVEIDMMSNLYNETTSQLMIETLLKKEYDCNKINAFLLLDIDNFKQINYSGNFLFGDQIMRQMGQIIEKNITPNCIGARINGDTFSIFYHNFDSKEAIYQSAIQLQEKLSTTYHFHDSTTQLTISGGLIYLFSKNMSYIQIYQCALHALETAKRRGKNQVLSYQEIEKVELNFKIELIINPNDYTILSMSPTGQILFNCTFPTKKPIKCYELIHNRKTPCPFCSQNIDFDQTNMRECFISKIDKLMYIKEHLSYYEGDTVRKIEMRDSPFDLSNNQQNCDLQRFLEVSWKNIGRDIPKENAFDNLLHQLGIFFHAQSVLLFQQKDDLNTLKLTSSWYYDNKVSKLINPQLDINLVEAMMHTVAPQKHVVVLDENSADFNEMASLYPSEQLPLPLLFLGIYDKDKLVSCLIVETIKQNIKTVQPIEVISDVISKVISIYNLNNKYTFSLTHDQKTGLNNYDTYIKDLRDINTDIYSTFGMIEITIVNFKAYNQQYGLAQGDDILRFIATMISKHFGRKLSYRISNAHFMVLCPDIDYENFIERYNKFYQELVEFYDQWIICENVWEKNSIVLETMQELLQEKTKLAVNKKINHILFKSDLSVSRILERLNTSLKNAQFLTFLQPKAYTKNNQICGAEALIRFNDPQKGIIPPGRFLPEIERAGLIRHIDLFILKDVCRIINQWLKTDWEPFTISVNYSRATILEPGILEETNKIVEAYQIPKELIEIEVTETIGSIDSASLKNIVSQFLAAGYKIALDDFGAEYSNIYILYSLHLSSLKLDRKIISDIYHDKRAQLVIKNIINICQQLNITCVAEGVETKEQLDVLKDMSCDVIQGYYLNKPLSENDFNKLLKN